MGGSSSPPPAPDPVATAAAQTGENVTTAIANAQLSHVPQTDQYGNTTSYNQTGSTSMTDPLTGTKYSLPQYSETTSMSPTNAALYSNLQGLEGTNLQTANNLATSAQGRLSTPLDLSPYMTTAKAPTAADINGYANTAWEQPFNQTWTQQQQQLDQKLADQGVAPGSTAYGNAEYNFSQNQQQAMNQYSSGMYGTATTAALGAYNSQLAANGQNAQLATQEYNQPLNSLRRSSPGRRSRRRLSRRSRRRPSRRRITPRSRTRAIRTSSRPTTRSNRQTPRNMAACSASAGR